MPEMGSRRPEFDPPNHQFRYHAVLKNFVIVYEETSEFILIVRIIHGARNLLGELMRDNGDGQT